MLYFILPTQLRDKVPALRNAILLFVWAMRRLEGQVHSYDHATNLEILPGSRTVDKRIIHKIHGDLIRSLCLIEGCTPASHLKPAFHHFVHYAQYTLTHGNSRIFWMMCFERYYTPCPPTHPSTPNIIEHTPHTTGSTNTSKTSSETEHTQKRTWHIPVKTTSPLVS